MEEAHPDSCVESTDPDRALDVEVQHPDIGKSTAPVALTYELEILVDLGVGEPAPDLDDGRDPPRLCDQEASKQDSVTGVRLQEGELIGPDDWIPKISKEIVERVQSPWDLERT